MQTKRESLIENFTNIGIGYTIAILSQLMVFPLFDIDIPFSDNLLIGFYFTVISLIRGYTIRRWFNQKTINKYANR